MSGGTRLLIRNGTRYHVSLAPKESRRGVAVRVNAVVFETEDGRWVGSTALDSSIPLWSLTSEELHHLFARALA